MKLAAFTIALTLLLLSHGLGVKRQNPPARPAAQTDAATARLLELEEQFRELDEQTGEVEVEVTGDKERSGVVRLRVVQNAQAMRPPPPKDTANANTSASHPPAQNIVSLLDIDLSGLEVSDAYINAKIAAAFAARRVGTLPGVAVRQVGATADYEVFEDYTYDSGSYRITAPRGFVYDRASIPRIFWVLVDKDSLSNVPPLFHDLLYRRGGRLPNNLISPAAKIFTREETDNLFYELMTKCGVVAWRREAAYQAVRRFSWFAWKGH